MLFIYHIIDVKIQALHYPAINPRILPPRIETYE